jgi:hypothetical protein
MRVAIENKWIEISMLSLLARVSARSMKHLRLLRLPGKGTTNAAMVADVEVIVDLQAISKKVANADAAARSIWFFA